MKVLSSTRLGDTKMDVSDIVGSRFISQRCTNPLSPRYTMRVQSSLGHTSTQNTDANQVRFDPSFLLLSPRYTDANQVRFDQPLVTALYDDMRVQSSLGSTTMTRNGRPQTPKP